MPLKLVQYLEELQIPLELGDATLGVRHVCRAMSEGSVARTQCRKLIVRQERSLMARAQPG
eukprot:scaffold234757_cov44-Prasinocladus_malaysianus.AAC.1